MSYLNGTATDDADLLADLRTFLKTSTGSGGPGWTEQEYDSGSKRMWFTAPGLGGGESIPIGFDLVRDTGADAFALRCWMAKVYNGALPWNGQVGMTAIGYQPIWDASMPYWFVANGQRAIVVTKVSTVYTASYVGKFLPFGTTSEFPQPYYLGAPRASNTRWSSASENFRNFYDPGEASHVLMPSGTWYAVSNFKDVSGAETDQEASNYVWPYQGFVTGNYTRERFRELRNNLDGTYPLFPLTLLTENPTTEALGELDGAYAVPAFSAAAEDTITVGSDTYLVVPNVFRSQRYHYAAIKLA